MTTNYGLTDFTRRQIKISKSLNLSVAETLDTILHECIHAWLFSIGSEMYYCTVHDYSFKKKAKEINEQKDFTVKILPK